MEWSTRNVGRRRRTNESVIAVVQTNNKGVAAIQCAVVPSFSDASESDSFLSAIRPQRYTKMETYFVLLEADDD